MAIAVRALGCLLERLAEPVSGVNAKYLQRFRLRHEFELFQRQFERTLFRVALDIDVKLRRGEAAIDHIAFQLGHVDAVGGEPAQRLVQRRGNVAYLKDKSGDDTLFLAARPFWLARQYDEAGGIVFGVGDVLLENAKTVDFCRQLGRQSRAGDVVSFGDFACGPGSVGRDYRLDAELADHVAALAERVDVTFDGPERAQRGAARRHELMLHRQEPFGDDMQLRSRHQVMDVGYASGHRVVDRDHRQRGAAVAHRGKGIFEGGASKRRVFRVCLFAGDMRIGARLALKSDLAALARVSRLLGALFLGHDRFVSMARAFSKSCSVSTPSGTAATSATSMRMPASSAR